LIDIQSLKSSKLIAKTSLWGVASLICYVVLYLFEDVIIELAEKGEWYFLIPISAAFVFSVAHGNFTAHFWDMLGIRAKK